MNEYGKEFLDIVSRYETFPFFQMSRCSAGGKAFEVAQFQAPPELLNHCVRIARKKAQFTMDAGQDERPRGEKLKEINQFKGVLAEMAIQLYFHILCGVPLPQITRWDLERESFVYSPCEYDLCFQPDHGRKYTIESRSSSSYSTGLSAFMTKYDVIGRYTNAKKSREKISDLYVRPVYQYTSRMREEEYKARIINTYKDMQDGKLKLYLTAAASREDMFGPHGYEKSMRQGKTVYRCIKIVNAHDIRYVDAWIEDKKRGQQVISRLEM